MTEGYATLQNVAVLSKSADSKKQSSSSVSGLQSKKLALQYSLNSPDGFPDSLPLVPTCERFFSCSTTTLQLVVIWLSHSVVRGTSWNTLRDSLLSAARTICSPSRRGPPIYLPNKSYCQNALRLYRIDVLISNKLKWQYTDARRCGRIGGLPVSSPGKGAVGFYMSEQSRNAKRVLVSTAG